MREIYTRYCALHPSVINSGKFYTSHLSESELTIYLIAHLPVHGIISWINCTDSWRVSNAWEVEIASYSCNFFKKALFGCFWQVIQDYSTSWHKVPYV